MTIQKVSYDEMTRKQRESNKLHFSLENKYTQQDNNTVRLKKNQHHSGSSKNIDKD